MALNTVSADRASWVASVITDRVVTMPAHLQTYPSPNRSITESSSELVMVKNGWNAPDSPSMLDDRVAIMATK